MRAAVKALPAQKDGRPRPSVFLLKKEDGSATSEEKSQRELAENIPAGSWRKNVPMAMPACSKRHGRAVGVSYSPVPTDNGMSEVWVAGSALLPFLSDMSADMETLPMRVRASKHVCAILSIIWLMAYLDTGGEVKEHTQAACFITFLNGEVRV